MNLARELGSKRGAGTSRGTGHEEEKAKALAPVSPPPFRTLQHSTFLSLLAPKKPGKINKNLAQTVWLCASRGDKEGPSRLCSTGQPGTGRQGEEATLDSSPTPEDGDQQLDCHPMMNHWAALEPTGLPVLCKVWGHVTLAGREQICMGTRLRVVYTGA
jgi:hypothetical protein